MSFVKIQKVTTCECVNDDIITIAQDDLAYTITRKSNSEDLNGTIVLTKEELKSILEII